MNRHSNFKERNLSKSMQKQSRKMAFQKQQKQQQNNLLTIKINSTLSFQMARLAVYQKLLYIQTCNHQKLPLQTIFKHYPYNKFQQFKDRIEALLKQKTNQNPQHSAQTYNNNKYIKDQNGYHIVEHVDQLGINQTINLCQKVNKNRELFNGTAISIFQNGRIFQGNYHDGNYCGLCLEINQNKDLYIGHFKDGIRTGNGIFYSFDADQVYQGSWEGDLPHGQGKYVTVQSHYKGEFSNGVKNGAGTQNFLNGDYYIGQFVNGKCSGYGQYYWTDGSCYRGDFSNGVRHGYGIWQDQKESYYGCYKLDMKHGIGVYTWKNKRLYKGSFKQDFREGYGQLYTIGGIVKDLKLLYKGVWEMSRKCPQVKISQSDIKQFNAFMDKQKKVLSSIPLRKQKYGHKNCVPFQGCMHKH